MKPEGLQLRCHVSTHCKYSHGVEILFSSFRFHASSFIIMFSRTAYRIYNAALCPLLPAAWIYTQYRRYGLKKSPASVRGLWGFVPSEVDTALSTRSGPRVWIHAVSVGETLAARPVARALREAMPDANIALSCITDTGFETAQSALKAGEIDATFYFPLDVPLAVKRTLKTIKPNALLLMETELWPNVLHLTRQSGAKTFLINGRVSDNLLQRAPKMGRLWRWMMGNLDALLMRSRFDAERMKQIGASRSRVHVMGDVKLDALPDDEQNHAERARWKRVLGLDSEVLFVAGSTHPGEEEIILDAFQTIRGKIEGARLLIAPRHIERAGEVETVIRAAGFNVLRRTQLKENSTDKGAVFLLDTVGELSTVYAAAEVAFVGGSLIERGGHNVLEPLLRGVPVLFGPHVANFREAARFAQDSGGGKMVHNAEELAIAALLWLQNEEKRNADVNGAREQLREHCGAARRVADFVARELGYGR